MQVVGYSLSAAQERLGGTDRWVRRRGSRRAEAATGSSAPAPQGTPVKRGREKQGRWDGIRVSTVECPGGGGWPGPENWTRRLYREPSPGAAVGPQPPLRASAQASAAPGRLQDGTCVSGHAGASCTSWRPGSPAPAEPVWGATRGAGTYFS